MNHITLATSVLLLSSVAMFGTILADTDTSNTETTLKNVADFPLNEKREVLRSAISDALALTEHGSHGYTAKQCTEQLEKAPSQDAAVYRCPIVTGYGMQYTVAVEVINSGGVLIALPELLEKQL